MPGLTAKVFRTYHASTRFQEELTNLTDPASVTAEKVLQYSIANHTVALLCNHLLPSKSCNSSKTKLKVLVCEEEVEDLKSRMVSSA